MSFIKLFLAIILGTLVTTIIIIPRFDNNTKDIMYKIDNIEKNINKIQTEVDGIIIPSYAPSLNKIQNKLDSIIIPNYAPSLDVIKSNQKVTYDYLHDDVSRNLFGSWTDNRCRKASNASRCNVVDQSSTDTIKI